MKFVKPRKPRGRKLNGYKSYDLCPHCYSRGCDPMAQSPKFYDMVQRRLQAGVCVACGYNPCRCKSSRLNRTNEIQTHNNKRTKHVR